MNLQFTNKGGNFVSEFEVTSDFNLHIEGVRLSDMHIYQKTAGGSYAKVTDFPSERSQDRVADFDFASLVYPKFIKVVCATEPTYAEIATDGEVTEIKSQSKEVEITSNGVTEIAPDAGFGYLSGVKVNVNVSQSGGGDAPSGGGEWKYFDTSKVISSEFLYGMLQSIGHIVKVNLNNKTVIGSGAYLVVSAAGGTVLAVGCNTSAYYYQPESGIPLSTIGELLSMNIGEFTYEEMIISQYGLIPITEEEFLNLEA